MKSLRELYTVGRGPSSSHTIGPTRACCLFRKEHPDADGIKLAQRCHAAFFLSK